RTTLAQERAAHHSVDELDIARALAIAVASTVLGTSLVVWILGHAAISVHGHKVQGAVEAAADARDVHVKGKLVAEQGEHLVRLVILHEIQPAANVGA